MSEVMCRIWLVRPRTSDATQGFDPKANDVVVIFKPEVGITTLIKIDENGNQIPLVLVTPVSTEKVQRVFSDFIDVRRIINDENNIPFKQLGDEEAQILRDLIIRANSNDANIRNAFIKFVDEEEEDDLISDDVGKEIEALIDSLDALITIIAIFDPPLLRKREMSKKFKDITSSLEERARKLGSGYDRMNLMSKHESEFNFGTQVFEKFDQIGLTRKLQFSSLTDFERTMVEKYQENYFEDASIRQAFYEHSGLPYDEDDDDEEPDEEQILQEISKKYLRRIIDAETGRRITIFWAHRSASRARDLAASDIIYVTESHQSILLVQHKKLNSGDLSLDSRDKTQKDELLAICGRQVSNCSNQNSIAYKPEHEMRLLDCPVYYALGASIRKSRYLPGCMVERILTDWTGNPTERKRRIKRSLTRKEFENSVNKTLIGSNPDEFDTLKRAVIASWEGNILAVEQETV